jgi:hypothetical protein
MERQLATVYFPDEISGTVIMDKLLPKTTKVHTDLQSEEIESFAQQIKDLMPRTVIVFSGLGQITMARFDPEKVYISMTFCVIAFPGEEATEAELRNKEEAIIKEVQDNFPIITVLSTI